MLCNSICQRCGYDGFYSNRFLRHGAFLDAACADVVEKQNADFVSGYQLIASIRAFHGDTNAVCIRVGCQHQVCAGLFCKIQAFFQCSKDFRVRIAAGGEVSVRILLLRNDGDISDADVF